MTGSNVTTGKTGSSQHSPKQKLEACGFAVMLLSFSEERSIKLEMKRSGYVLHGMYACMHRCVARFPSKTMLRR